MQGDNVTHGYFQNPEANAAAITADGWLRTGDLALLHEGKLYVTGRSKEIIFVNGQNYYPHDLEVGAAGRAGPRTRQGGCRRRACGRLAHRRAGAVRAASGRHGRLHPARDEGDAPDQRACGRRSGARGAGEAHPEDDQRQAAAQRAGHGVRRRRVRGGTGGVRPGVGCAARPGSRSQGPRRGTAQGDRRRRDARQARGHRRQPVRRRRELADADPDPREDRRGLPGPGRPDRAVRFPDHLDAGEACWRRSWRSRGRGRRTGGQEG